MYQEKKKRIYLRIIADTRSELLSKLRKKHFIVRGRRYSINDVYAEADKSSTAIGAIFGGIIGALGGPIGAITGGTIGGLVGNSSDSKEEHDVYTFNKSRV